MFIEHFCLFFSSISRPINISCERCSAARISAVLVLLVVLPCRILTWFISSYQFCALQTRSCPPIAPFCNYLYQSICNSSVQTSSCSLHFPSRPWWAFKSLPAPSLGQLSRILGQPFFSSSRLFCPDVFLSEGVRDLPAGSQGSLTDSDGSPAQLPPHTPSALSHPVSACAP